MFYCNYIRCMILNYLFQFRVNAVFIACVYLCFLSIQILGDRFSLHARLPGILRLLQLHLIIHRNIHDNLARRWPPGRQAEELTMREERTVSRIL